MSEESQTSSEPNLAGPLGWKRNPYGLLEGVKYEFNSDNSINWRAMIPKEFLTPNKEKTSETDVSKLEDKDLIILLGGIKYLAKLRGYTAVSHDPIIFPEHHYVAVKTKICWIGNYETDGQPVCFEEVADANDNNTKSFAKLYLTSIAANRGFVRAVRNFLGINIVGDAELGEAKLTSDPGNAGAVKPQDTLQEFLEKNKCQFERVKNLLIKKGMEEANEWNSVQEIPTAKVYEVRTAVVEAIAEKATEKANKKEKSSQKQTNPPTQ